ncbi:MAG: TonB-dependent receptor [Ectothiorhodospiraceae bacterium]|nr:TonB-dependent receptor [Ectothiorhodospiraceae bacterium]
MLPLVVTAGGTEQDVENAPASVTVITREELERRQIRNIADAIRNVEGVDVDGLDARSNKTGNRSISIRGLPPEYTLILIDGKRQNVPGTVAPNAFGDTSTAFLPPVAAIERIEVIRGPLSTLYGSDALGGVVNIITRRPGEEWGGNLTLDSTFQTDSEFGGYHTFEAYGAGPLIEDTLSMQIYGRTFERAESRINFPTGTEPSLVDNRTMGQNPVGANINTLGGKLIFTPTRDHEFYIGYDITEQTYNNDRGQMGRIDSGRGYDDELGFNRDQISLGYTGFYQLGTWNVDLYRNSTETTGRLIPSAAVPPNSPRLDSDRRLESQVDVVDTNFVMPLGNHVVTVGAQYLDAELTDGIPRRTFSNSQVSVFAEDEWFITNTFSLTTGLRYEDNDSFGSQVTPRAYAVWNATDRITVKGGAGRGYRAPFLEQLEDGIIGYGNQGQDPLFGNPDLKPEVSNNYEASIAYSNRRNFRGQVTVFYTELKDRIERPTAAAGETDEFANIGESVIQGVELAGSYTFLPDWTISGNYTYTDSEVRSSNIEGFDRGDPLFGVPKHRINARLGWQTTPRMNSFVEGEYVSSRHRPDSFHEPQLGGNAQGASEALGDFYGFAVFNLGATYAITRNARVTTAVLNVFDKDFNDYRAYPLRNDPDTTAYSNVYNNIYEPRRIFVSMSMDF